MGNTPQITEPKKGEVTTTGPSDNGNPFSRNRLPEEANAGAVSIEMERAIAEVQASLIIAKRFPRDPHACWEAAMQACSRPGLANDAFYSFKRGGQLVEGASIRLAEELARCWTNIEYGMRELSNKDGVTELEAFAWDKETNTTSSQRFTVRHKRDTRNGSYDITDQRDIYELGANNGARRMRARILAILPSDLVQAAEEKCRQTLEGGSQKPMADQVREMTSAFQERFQVTGEMIERLIGKKRGDFLPEDITRLRGVFKSLKDGMAQVSDFFGNPEIADPKADGKKDGNKPPAASNDNKPPAATKPSGGSRRKSNKATTTKKDGEGEQQDQPAQETQDDNPAAEQEQEQTAEQQSGDGATTGSGEDDDFDGMFDND